MTSVKVLIVKLDPPETFHLSRQSAQDFDYGIERASGELSNYNQWVEVTHATKKKVMSAVSPADLKAIGCSNPDIWVKGKSTGKGLSGDIPPDTIILTPPKGHIKSGSWNQTIRITEVSANEVLGEDWAKQINPIKFGLNADLARYMLLANHPLEREVTSILESGRLITVFVDRDADLMILTYHRG